MVSGVRRFLPCGGDVAADWKAAEGPEHACEVYLEFQLMMVAFLLVNLLSYPMVHLRRSRSLVVWQVADVTGRGAAQALRGYRELGDKDT